MEPRRALFILVRRNCDLQNSFASLNAVPVFEVSRLDANAVHECPVGRAKIPQKSLRRRDLKYAVMAREKPVVREAELGVLAAADHERIVLFKCKISSGLWARDDMECNAHQIEL
jgi:hypothetical protein